MIAIFLNNCWLTGFWRNGLSGLVLGMSLSIYLDQFKRIVYGKVWVHAILIILNVCLLKGKNICFKIFIFKIFFPEKSLFPIKDLKMPKLVWGRWLWSDTVMLSVILWKKNEIYKITIFRRDQKFIFLSLFQEILNRKKSEFFNFIGSLYLWIEKNFSKKSFTKIHETKKKETPQYLWSEFSTLNFFSKSFKRS